MVAVDFTVHHEFSVEPNTLWDAMIDWEGHGEWIPATRVEIDSGDPTAIGGRFTGYTGYGPLTLVDHMVVKQIDWDDEASTGFCEVEKIGPLLAGTAGFTVSPTAHGSQIEWFEKVTVDRIPSILNVFEAPVSKIGALGFSLAMKSLDRSLSA